MLKSPQGERFLELKALLEEFLVGRLSNGNELAQETASQLLNVLSNCDSITYDEPGAAEAYALLHFLNRFHRFQLIFDRLHSLNLMPIKTRDIDILDVGTGPGPSMFAASDFYVNTLRKGTSKDDSWGRQGFNIDYVEQSRKFRDWLHHFTEHVNYYCPSGKPWWVPFHHGTFDNFSGLQFNSTRHEEDYDSDGEAFRKEVRIRRRFDLIVLSNFLTTRSQVRSFSKEIEACARYLRHNGIIIIVGAPNRSKKYREVYSEITSIITQGRYSNKKIVAKCFAVDVPDAVMKYSWSDPYGMQVKDAISATYRRLINIAAEYIPSEARKKIDQTILPEYSNDIEWQIFAFKKWARPRLAKGEVPIKRNIQYEM